MGAIVLALAAAVLLPLLLESEPKPLGDDVSIQIPPIDKGKFINPLSPGAAPDPKVKSDGGGLKTAQSVPAPAPVPETLAQAPAGSPAATAEPPRGAPSTAPAAPPASATPAPAKTDAGAAAPELTRPSARPSNAKPEAKSAAAAGAKAGAPANGGSFAVQVAAFSDRYGARSLVAKLKRGGFPGYTEEIASGKGTLHRVRVGPYPSREGADAARAKLKAAGFQGVVTRSG